MRAVYLPPEGERASMRLTRGSEYVILKVHVSPKRGTWFRVLANREEGFPQTPIIVPSRCFEIVSDHVPRNWRIRTSGARLDVAPEAWLRPGFWEAIFDGSCEETQWARDAYDRELAVILSEDQLARERDD